MARQTKQGNAFPYLTVLAVLLAAAVGADALCYVSPITGVRTCTSFGWPGSNGGYQQPPRNGHGNSGYNQQPKNNYGNNGGGYQQGPNNGYDNNRGGYQQGGNGYIGRPGYAPAAPTYAPTPAPTPAPTYAPTYAPTPAPYHEAPAPTRGCFGDLPFGLQNCVCDGAEIGEAAGLAACSMVFAQCAPVVGFSAPADPQLDAIQQACDSLTGSSCILTAKQLAMANPTCASLLQGAGSCSPAEAEAILEASVSRTCEPLCPDCDKPLENKPQEYDDAYSSKHHEGEGSYQIDGYEKAGSYGGGEAEYEESSQAGNAYGTDNAQYPQTDNSYTNDYPQGDNSYTNDYPQDDNTYSNDYPQGDNSYSNDYPQGDNTYSNDYPQGDNTYSNDYPQGDNTYSNDYPQGDNTYSNDYPQGDNTYSNDYPQGDNTYSNDYPQGGEEYEQEVHESYDAADPHAQGKGCFGGLPFGLESCVCDGASIGEAAGLAACSAVFSECMPFVPFSAGGAEEAIERACDTLAMSSCSDTARQLAVQNEQCSRLLFEGSRNCSVDKAREIFRRTIDNVCTPLCPGCATLP